MTKKHQNLPKSNQKQVKSKEIKPIPSLFENNTFIYVLLGIAALIVLIARLHLLSFPFERDEGEYAYMGKLLLEGHPPYSLAYNMKLPGTYFMYALIMTIFGKSIVGVHLGLCLIIIASMFLVFFISKTFITKIGSVIAAASYGIMGTSWTLLGQAAHATHFVVFFALLAIYMVMQVHKSEKYKFLWCFFSGLSFSLAFICKQSGLFYVFFGFTVLIFKGYNQKPISDMVKNLSIFSLGFIVPVLIMLLYFYFSGNFDKFWFWTVKYLSKYSGQVTLSDAPMMFKLGIGKITANYTSVGYTALWVVSIIGIPFIFINKSLAQNKIIILSFIFFSFLTIIPGFYFREHYFITFLPAVSFLIAVFFEFFNRFFIDKLKTPNLIFLNIFIFLLLIGSGVKANKEYLFKLDPKMSCKYVYGTNPFVESVEIAQFLENNTTVDDKIAILGSEPQICFYANRYSATGYIYTYNLVEIHSYALSMQKEMAGEIEANKPKYLLYINITSSWLGHSNCESFIFNWADDYIKKYYKLVAYCNALPDKISSLKTSDQFNSEQKSEELIYIFVRNLEQPKI